MSWYNNPNKYNKYQKTALRKHMMRVDLRVYVGEENNFTNENDLTSGIKSIITSSIITGLDVIGIVSPNGPNLGWKAKELAKLNQLDIWVIPGEEYLCSDKFRILAYLLQQPIPPNLQVDQAISFVHQNNGYVISCNVTKRQAQHLNSLKGTASAPDAVEIFNGVSGSYQDITVDYPKFISSSAKNAKELEASNAFTLIQRKELESMGLLPEDQGIDYLPKYLQQDNHPEDAQPQNVNQGA